MGSFSVDVCRGRMECGLGSFIDIMGILGQGETLLGCVGMSLFLPLPLSNLLVDYAFDLSEICETLTSVSKEE